jgi:hypothetical protein
MGRHCCMGCLTWIKDDEACPLCAKRARTASAGAAPEFSSKRAAAPGGPGTKREDGEDSRSSARSSRAAAIFRHPSGRPRISEITSFPCFLHNQPDRFECEGCLRNGEFDDEFRWVNGADL